MHAETKEWREASVLSSKMLLLTAEELTQVNVAVFEVLAPYLRRERIADAPADARTVSVQFAAFPTD